MASVTYGKCIMANVIMAKVYMAKVLWQMKLSPGDAEWWEYTEGEELNSLATTPTATPQSTESSTCISGLINNR